MYGLKILDSQLVRLLSPTKCFRISEYFLSINRITSRFRSLIKSFREYVLDRNNDGLDPKLIYNAHFPPEYKELANIEVLELNEFLQFHGEIESGNDVGCGECQCSRMSVDRENLTKCKV